MKSQEIRNAFLRFFEEKGHKIVPSAPIVQKNDPTLMFTNAGMNQFKDYFLGNKTADYKRIADTQKCLRVSGKHNDLEEVGIDTYHHTMFEMLGNWSFGEYFKKEAIQWAYELLVERYKLDKNRIYVTVFGGDDTDDLPKDEDALSIWSNLIDKDRIMFFDKKDNFWEMGDTGPCGPCSEIHYDLRPEEERLATDARKFVNQDHPQVIEIWNLVFMEFNRLSNGSLQRLPDQHVDTGMGFERLTTVLQNKASNYDTDIFQPLINYLETKFGVKYKQDEQTDISLRVIADHIRAIVFTIADGQLPSNTGAGYVIRRILRRAVRYGFRYLNAGEPFLYELTDVLANQFREVFPEVHQQKDFIKKIIQEEETTFLRTLAAGTRIFEKYTTEIKGETVEGKFAFELYDTFGFPLDLTRLMASEAGLEVDEKGFEEELKAQKDRSKKAAFKTEGDWVVVDNQKGGFFIGYDALEAPVQLLRYREVKQKDKTYYHMVFNQTPFYPEGGGQVGDTGFLNLKGERIRITDTRKENELIIHVSEKLPQDPNAEYNAVVDNSKRLETENNHTATHLLHAALREILGTHISQKGSLVNNEYLRFDFSHFSKLTEEEIEAVEHMVNLRIRQNIPLNEERNVPVQDAMQRGAMALFGEKYGEVVRVITFDEKYSVELCGGTHAPATGRIGYFKIRSESAIAAGVRRIEAVSGYRAECLVNSQMNELRQLKSLLKNPQNLISSVENLLEENKNYQQKLEGLMHEKVKQISQSLQQSAIEINDDVKLIAQQVELESAEAGKNLVFELKNKTQNTIILLGAALGDKGNLWLVIPEELVKSRNLNANEIIRETAKEIEGGGGGQAFFATAGGKNPSNMTAAIEKGSNIIKNKLS